MGIEAKRRGWYLGKFKIDLFKIMTSNGPRKIKTLILDIFEKYDFNIYSFLDEQS